MNKKVNSNIFPINTFTVYKCIPFCRTLSCFTDVPCEEKSCVPYYQKIGYIFSSSMRQTTVTNAAKALHHVH